LIRERDILIGQKAAICLSLDLPYLAVTGPRENISNGLEKMKVLNNGGCGTVRSLESKEPTPSKTQSVSRTDVVPAREGLHMHLKSSLLSFSEAIRL
jgi:hypothetical protein